MKQLSLLQVEAKKPLLQEGNQWGLSVDGASRNNPGPAGAGIVIKKNGKTVDEKGFFLGPKTNNQAEYLALVLGLFLLKDLVGPDDIVMVLSDSQLLVQQIKGKYRVKHVALRPLHAAAKQLLNSLNYDIGHVLRDDNTEADAMANYGIDKKKRVPETLLISLRDYGIVL